MKHFGSYSQISGFKQCVSLSTSEGFGWKPHVENTAKLILNILNLESKECILFPNT